MNKAPSDQSERDRFAQDLECNFSVLAAAGAGKTTAITDRIVEIARRKPEWLPRLVVVTFTNRAADEMQQRARQRIFEASLPIDTLTTFNRAFFGTIHSFCAGLLTTYGHHLGLPSRLEVIGDDQELWNDFVQRTGTVGSTLSPEDRRALARHVQLRDVMQLGRRGPLPAQIEQHELACPTTVDLRRLHNYQARAGATRIEAMKIALREWEQKYHSEADFVPLIECTATGRFEEMFQEAFSEFHEWLSCCALRVAAEVQANYRRFRAERGAVTFDDQIALALELTNSPDVVRRIRARDYIVILDEAQDTDPQQFSILTEITRPPSATGCWIENEEAGPRPGRFCMVGDFQQSIYKDRGDLKQYQRVHDALIMSDAGTELKFSVTFRLDQKQIDFVNECFREILDAPGQVKFIKLNARPERLPGQVIRFDVAPKISPEATDTQKMRAAATELARWVAQTGCEKLRARSWDQVAILCPRKKWFRPIADALRRVEINSQIQSETDVKADSPAHAWFTALITIMTQPHSAFEIVGVLREIFGISDHDLAIFSNRKRDRFQIQISVAERGRVSETLDLLAGIHREIAEQPLFSAVSRIVESTHLHERLNSLPPEDVDGIQAELDELLLAAADAEAEGMTLEEFAETLRANFTSEREARVPRKGAIQLITCQKAKGLEWDAVILPFFWRQVYTSDENFPRIIAIPEQDRAIVAFSKSDLAPDVKSALKQAHLFEWERILYVALTRSRHTLVLATDQPLFAKQGGLAHSDSMVKWFRADPGEINEKHTAGLPTASSGCAQTHDFQIARQQAEVARPRMEITPSAGSLTEARARAENFPRRSIPSSFTPDTGVITSTGADKQKETEPEFRATTVPSPATRYGIWWHELLQQIPGLPEKPFSLETADNIFSKNLPSSPDSKRSTREWKLLREHVASQDSFLQIFNGRELVARSEMPFLWAADEHRSVEGVIDLAIINPDQKKLLLLDWKTNELKPDQVDKLRAHYLPQLAAYWKALAEITKFEISAAIYSTAVGALVHYDTGELEKEWARLAKLPLDQFKTNIVEPIVRGTVKTGQQLELF